MNHHPERRRAPRVPTTIPVRLRARGRQVDGVVCDLSRIGTGIRIPLSEFDLTPGTSEDTISKTISALLGSVVSADLNHDRLGTLVRRSLRIVRIARPADCRESVDIGCMLRVPLSDDEINVLGLTLPDCHLPEGVYSAHEEFARLHERRRNSAGADGDTENAIAFLSAQHGRPGAPVRATDAAWTEKGVVLLFGSRRGMGLGVQERDAGALFERFVREYGDEAYLLLVQNQKPLWSGSVRLRAVEVDPLRDELFLEFEAGVPTPVGV